MKQQIRATGILLALLGVVGVARSAFDTNPRELYENINSNSKYLRSYLKQRHDPDNVSRKLEEFCPEKVEAYQNAMQSLKVCVDKIDESEETVCSAIKHHFLKCSKPLVAVLTDCFPEGKRDFPALMFKSVTTMSDYICKANGEHIIELMNSCIFTPNYRFTRCERRVRSKIQQFRSALPTKNDICDFSQSLRTCIQSHLEFACGHHITRDAVLGLYDAAFAPCSDVNEIDDLNREDVILAVH